MEINRQFLAIQCTDPQQHLINENALDNKVDDIAKKLFIQITSESDKNSRTSKNITEKVPSKPSKTESAPKQSSKKISTPKKESTGSTHEPQDIEGTQKVTTEKLGKKSSIPKKGSTSSTHEPQDIEGTDKKALGGKLDKKTPTIKKESTSITNALKDIEDPLEIVPRSEVVVERIFKKISENEQYLDYIKVSDGTNTLYFKVLYNENSSVGSSFKFIEYAPEDSNSTIPKDTSKGPRAWSVVVLSDRGEHLMGEPKSLEGSTTDLDVQKTLVSSKSDIHRTSVKDEPLRIFGSGRIYINTLDVEKQSCDTQLIHAINLLEAGKITPTEFWTKVSEINQKHAEKRLLIFYQLATICENLRGNIQNSKLQEFLKELTINFSPTVYQTGMGNGHRCYFDPDIEISLNAAHTACLSHPTVSLKVQKALDMLMKGMQNGWNPFVSKDLEEVGILGREIKKIEVMEYLHSAGTIIKASLPELLSKVEFQGHVKDIIKEGKIDKELLIKLFGTDDITEENIEGLLNAAAKDKDFPVKFAECFDNIFRKGGLEKGHIELLTLFGVKNDEFLGEKILLLKEQAELKFTPGKSIIDWMIDQSYLAFHEKTTDFGMGYLANKLQKFGPQFILGLRNTELLFNLDESLVSKVEGNILRGLLQSTDLLPIFINSHVDKASDDLNKQACEILQKVIRGELDAFKAVGELQQKLIEGLEKVKTDFLKKLTSTNETTPSDLDILEIMSLDTWKKEHESTISSTQEDLEHKNSMYQLELLSYEAVKTLESQVIINFEKNIKALICLTSPKFLPEQEARENIQQYMNDIQTIRAASFLSEMVSKSKISFEEALAILPFLQKNSKVIHEFILAGHSIDSIQKHDEMLAQILGKFISDLPPISKIQLLHISEVLFQENKEMALFGIAQILQNKLEETNLEKTILALIEPRVSKLKQKDAQVLTKAVTSKEFLQDFQKLLAISTPEQRIQLLLSLANGELSPEMCSSLLKFQSIEKQNITELSNALLQVATTNGNVHIFFSLLESFALNSKSEDFLQLSSCLKDLIFLELTPQFHKLLGEFLANYRAREEKGNLGIAHSKLKQVPSSHQKIFKKLSDYTSKENITVSVNICKALEQLSKNSPSTFLKIVLENGFTKAISDSTKLGSIQTGQELSAINEKLEKVFQNPYFLLSFLNIPYSAKEGIESKISIKEISNGKDLDLNGKDPKEYKTCVILKHLLENFIISKQYDPSVTGILQNLQAFYECQTKISFISTFTYFNQQSFFLANPDNPNGFTESDKAYLKQILGDIKLNSKSLGLNGEEEGIVDLFLQVASNQRLFKGIEEQQYKSINSILEKYQDGLRNNRQELHQFLFKVSTSTDETHVNLCKQALIKFSEFIHTTAEHALAPKECILSGTEQRPISFGVLSLTQELSMWNKIKSIIDPKEPTVTAMSSKRGKKTQSSTTEKPLDALYKIFIPPNSKSSEKLNNLKYLESLSEISKECRDLYLYVHNKYYGIQQEGVEDNALQALEPLKILLNSKLEVLKQQKEHQVNQPSQKAPNSINTIIEAEKKFWNDFRGCYRSLLSGKVEVCQDINKFKVALEQFQKAFSDPSLDKFDKNKHPLTWGSVDKFIKKICEETSWKDSEDIFKNIESIDITLSTDFITEIKTKSSSGLGTTQIKELVLKEQQVKIGEKIKLLEAIATLYVAATGSEKNVKTDLLSIIREMVQKNESICSILIKVCDKQEELGKIYESFQTVISEFAASIKNNKEPSDKNPKVEFIKTLELHEVNDKYVENSEKMDEALKGLVLLSTELSQIDLRENKSENQIKKIKLLQEFNSNVEALAKEFYSGEDTMKFLAINNAIRVFVYRARGDALNEQIVCQKTITATNEQQTSTQNFDLETQLSKGGLDGLSYVWTNCSKCEQVRESVNNLILNLNLAYFSRTPENVSELSLLKDLKVVQKKFDEQLSVDMTMKNICIHILNPQGVKKDTSTSGVENEKESGTTVQIESEKIIDEGKLKEYGVTNPGQLAQKINTLFQEFVQNNKETYDSTNAPIEKQIDDFLTAHKLELWETFLKAEDAIELKHRQILARKLKRIFFSSTKK